MQMKKLMMVAALAGLMSGVAQAATNVFAVKIEGQISTENTRQKVRNAAFVPTNGLLLVVIDTDLGAVDIVEGTGTVTNVTPVRTLMQSTAAVIFNGRSFTATLTPAGDAASVDLQNGVSFGGSLLISGRFGYNKNGKGILQANLAGIWNDAISGNTNASASVFNGSINSSSSCSFGRRKDSHEHGPETEVTK